MRYFIDTEFIEGFHKPLFGKRRHFIDLISIGIVAEDGRTYYAVSKEYNYKDADDWVKKNVIDPMYLDVVHGDRRNYCSSETFHKWYGKSNKQIAEDIKWFVLRKDSDLTTTKPEFYGYYSDYDWVVFCSLFGRMIDLPKGFPMYCRDLKQMMDEKVAVYNDRFMNGDEDFEWKLSAVKNKATYPKQANEHCALDDAKWNYELFKFLETL